MSKEYFVVSLFAILERIMYIGIPVMAIYGVVHVCTTSDTDPTLRGLFALAKKGRKWVLLVCMLCLILVGLILYDFAMWYRLDFNYLIQIPQFTSN